jgi:hypothetical protein
MEVISLLSRASYHYHETWIDISVIKKLLERYKSLEYKSHTVYSYLYYTFLFD